MVPDYALNMLSAAMNRYIALDPDAQEALVALAGTQLAVHVQALPMDLQLAVRFSADAIDINQHISAEINSHIYGSPIALARLVLADAKGAKRLLQDQVSIEGDIDAAMAVKDFFERIDIDWEAHLAAIVGDVVAYPIAQAIRTRHQWRKDSCDAIERNTTEYLQEELRYLPPAEEVEDFFSDIAELQMAVERLQLRIARLRATPKEDK